MKKHYNLLLNIRAIEDIQHSIDYYNTQKKGLGKRFLDDINEAFRTLKINPGYQVRNDNVRCYPLNVFPHMVHYTIEGNSIVVYAVIGIAMNPAVQWTKR